MASLVLGVAGAAALGPAGLAWGGALGMSGAQIGFIAGSTLGSMLFAPNMPDVQGPRMSDLKVQASTYGAPIPIYYGTARGAGQVIWSSDLIETSHEEEAGGKGGPSQSVTTYTYSVNCAIGICEGEITGIRKIWANGDLIYDASVGNLGPTGQSSNIRIYTGSETQTPDALLEAYLGAGNVPAHRGMAYVVFENLQLEKYGNRIPNFSFEVVNSGSATLPTFVNLTTVYPLHQIQHPFISNLYLSTSRDDGSSSPYIYLHITDAISKEDRRVAIDVTNASWVSGYITYVDYGIDPLTGEPYPLNEIWVCTSRYDYETTFEVAVAFDATSLAFKRRIVPATWIGIRYVGKMIFDKSVNKVLFASSGSSITSGYNYLEPQSLAWDGVKVTGFRDWYVGNAAIGDNSIALSGFDNNVVIFTGGNFVNSAPSTPATPYITYDSRRNRYAWRNSHSAGNNTYRTVKDDITFAVTDYATTSTVSSGYASLDYFPIADKYILSDGDNLYTLNADTFEVESSALVGASSGTIAYALEIQQMPEYLVASVVSPDGLAFIPITDRLSSNSVLLSSIVTDICSRVDLSASDINVTALTDQVAGYTIAQQMSARAALDGLQAAFFFDAVESD